MSLKQSGRAHLVVRGDFSSAGTSSMNGVASGEAGLRGHQRIYQGGLREGRARRTLSTLPEPNVREPLPDSLGAHLVLQDRGDEDVQAFAFVRLHIAQHSRLLVPVTSTLFDA